MSLNNRISIATFFGERAVSRSAKAKANVTLLILLKGISALANLAIVPLTLDYLDATKYGIWLTLSSVVGWVSIMDIGLGNGMRNKFAEAIAEGDNVRARSYVSTTYAVVAGVSSFMILAFVLVNPMIDWVHILNAHPDMQNELAYLSLIVFVFFCVRLVFGLIGTILIAHQEPARSSVLDAATSILSLSVVFGLTKTSAASLFWLGFSVSAISIVVPLAASVWYFGRQYKKFAPSLRLIKPSYAMDLWKLGAKFFIVQIAGVLIFSSFNIVIIQLFGPQEVTSFNIVFKYYSVVSTFFAVVLAPFWSASTDAFFRGETDWIKRAIAKLKMLWLGLVVVVIVMTLLASRVYSFWVGDDIEIPTALSIAMAVYVLIASWCAIFVNVINGIGKIWLQFWAAIIMAIVVIPLSIVLARDLELNSTGVIIAASLCLLPLCFVWPIQVGKLITGRAAGVWAK